MEAFENGDKKKRHTVAAISFIGYFSVDDRRKRIKRYAFPNENVLAWTGENKTKTLVGAKIFCFGLVETKMDTFKYALV